MPAVLPPPTGMTALVMDADCSWRSHGTVLATSPAGPIRRGGGPAHSPKRLAMSSASARAPLPHSRRRGWTSETAAGKAAAQRSPDDRLPLPLRTVGITSGWIVNRQGDRVLDRG